ncbi:hypothetical protein ACQ4PT_022829 [Festuca glaucescens]
MNDGKGRYAIREFNLSSNPRTDGDEHQAVAQQRLPPAIVRFESGLLAAIGTKIMVMESTWPKPNHAVFDLPFTGRANYDPVLDAWIGLSGDRDTLGYLCCCDVVSTNGASTDDPLDPTGYTVPPAWKLSKERLFGEDDLGEEHVGASLVYMGVNSFCLVHYFCVEDDDVSSSESDDDDELEIKGKCMLRLTTFSLEYDEKGHLRSGAHQRVRCYQLRRASYIPSF